jgi:hypothetical protein
MEESTLVTSDDNKANIIKSPGPIISSESEVVNQDQSDD